MSPSLIKVLLVDDASMICQTLEFAFACERSLRLAGYAQTAGDAAALFGRIDADVLLLDVLMPDMDGFELAKRAQKADPKLRILFFSGLNSIDYVERARAFGVAGWVVKDSIQEVIAAIKLAAAGAPFIAPRNDRHPVVIPSIDAPMIPTEGKGALTEREIEILKLTVQSFEVKEIADRLKISARTVEVHRAHIFQKLHTRSIATLTKYAIAHGFTSL
jgi:DNA-binding NarL/FixJ family response regulator